MMGAACIEYEMKPINMKNMNCYNTSNDQCVSKCI